MSCRPIRVCGLASRPKRWRGERSTCLVRCLLRRPTRKQARVCSTHGPIPHASSIVMGESNRAATSADTAARRGPLQRFCWGCKQLWMFKAFPGEPIEGKQPARRRRAAYAQFTRSRDPLARGLCDAFEGAVQLPPVASEECRNRSQNVAL